MTGLLQDLRFGIRSILRTPGLAVVSALTLGIGIALLTAVFSLTNAFFLRPLPFEEPERLVHVWMTDGNLGFEQLRMSAANWRDLRQQAGSVEDLGGYYYTTYTLGSDGGDPATVSASLLTPNLLEILGADVQRGRLLGAEDAVGGRADVVLISDRFWQRRFGGDEGALGSEVLLDERPHTVDGIMPPEFVFPFNTVDLWLPLAVTPEEQLRGQNGPLLVVGRLQPGESLETAQSEMATVMERLAREYPETNEKRSVNLVPLRSQLLFTYDIFAIVFPALFAAVLFVILIVCANIGNLLLARAADRSREIAFRLTLGASRWRLLRQLMTESALIGLSGAALGLAGAFWLTRGLERALPLDLIRVGRIEVDGAALLFASLVGLLSAVVFGLAPAFQALRVDLAGALKEGGRSASSGLGPRRLRNLLVVSQIALAMLLVTGAGLMTKTFLALQAVDLGFEAERLLTMEITLPTSKYADETAENRYFDRAVERLRSVPGVESAASVYPLPLNHESLGAEFEIEGREPASPDETLWTNTFWVGTDYFETLQIPLMSGRTFTIADDADSERVVMLNRRFAERFWPEESPVGGRVRIGDEWRTVVGVVADSIAFSLDEETPLILYYPQEQRSTRRRFLMVRTAGAPMSVYPSAEAVLRDIDPAQPVQNVRPMTEVVTTSLGPWLMGIGGLGFVGVGALFLAAMGLYGVISYSVNRRVQELGIRSALGAQRTDLLGLVLRQGLSLAAVGIAIGLVGALLLSRFLQSLLFGVGSLDPVTFLATPLVLLAVTFLATFLPARRATRVDPMVALRYE